MTNTRDVLAHTKGGLTTGDSEIFAFIALSPVELLPICQRPLQDPAGKVTRGLPILESNDSVDDRGGDAVCLLHEPPGAARQILLDGRQARLDALFIKNDEVSSIAGSHQPAVRQLPGRRIVEGQHADCFFQSELLLVANPVAQQMGLQ